MSGETGPAAQYANFGILGGEMRSGKDLEKKPIWDASGRSGPGQWPAARQF